MASRYVIRYGLMRLLGEFSGRDDDSFSRGTEVILRTDRGVEWGEVLSPATSRTRDLLGRQAGTGKILREANDDDRSRLQELHLQERVEYEGCRRMIEENRLQMQLVDAERVFGGERLVFYYVSEKRVDFRELVKSLAREFRTRIEMRQIGVRDEARLLADYGDCGKPVCCNTHLTEMPPVAMKMAKIQKATLDTAKISGRCGRLKCCLRYEYDTYVEYRRELPRVGSMVVTKEGQGKVIGQEILARKVLVVYEGQRRMLTDESDILTVIRSSDQRQKSRPQNAPATETPAEAPPESSVATATEAPPVESPPGPAEGSATSAPATPGESSAPATTPGDSPGAPQAEQPAQDQPEKSQPRRSRRRRGRGRSGRRRDGGGAPPGGDSPD